VDGAAFSAAEIVVFDFYQTGNLGATGPTGATGATGPAGPGVATGGTQYQFLVKNSGTNFDTVWSGIIDGGTP
jgi:hypothetical protein